MVHDTPTHSNRRTRRPGMHRGWRKSQMTPQALAKDIAQSIMLDQIHGQPVRSADMFTTCAQTIALVHTMLASER